MKRSRKPRPPAATGLPASYVEAEEDLIVRSVARWREFQGDGLTSEGSHAAFKSCFFEWLVNIPQDAPTIVRAARLGHPAADRALRHFVQCAMDADQFQQLPVSVRDYARESMAQAPLAVGYPSQARQVANNFARDYAICFCVERVRKRYPAVPLYMAKKQRRSAADLVGQAFGLGEAQVRRIHKADGEIAEKIAAFFAGYTNPLTNGPVPFVP